MQSYGWKPQRLQHSRNEAHRQHTIYADNFFTSMPLLTELESNGISLCGTYRTNRVGFPKNLTDKETLKKMKRGDIVARYKGNTSCVLWMDKRAVYVVSNAFMPDTTTVKCKNADGSTSLISCPVSVANYNCYMGGVDLTDQLKGGYGYNCKSKRWWFRLLFTCLPWQLSIHSFCTDNATRFTVICLSSSCQCHNFSSDASLQTVW